MPTAPRSSTPRASKGTNGSIAVAQEMAAADPSLVMLYQYGNEANPGAHYETTGPEILRDLPEIDVFVAGLGTGGTLTGTGRYLKERKPSVKIVAAAPHPGDLVQGLRSLDEGFIPPVLDQSLLDGRIVVDSQNSFAATKELMDKEGIFAGISGGAVLRAAQRVAVRHGARQHRPAAGRRRLEVPFDGPLEHGLRGPGRRPRRKDLVVDTAS